MAAIGEKDRRKVRSGSQREPAGAIAGVEQQFECGNAERSNCLGRKVEEAVRQEFNLSCQ